MDVSKYISNRLSLRNGANRAISPSLLVAVGGIAVSVIIMLLTIAIVVGFKHAITDKAMGFDSQITIQPLYSAYDDGTPILLTNADELTNDVSENLEQTMGGKNFQVAKTIRQPMILKSTDEFAGIVVRAFSGEYNTEFEQSMITKGSIDALNSNGEIIISQAVANKLSVDMGDKINAYCFTSSGLRQRRFKIGAIYSSDFKDYDLTIAYGNYAQLCKISDISEDNAQAIVVNGLPQGEIMQAATNLQGMFNQQLAYTPLPQPIRVTTVYQSGAMLFNWLTLLDANVVVILILMGAVSAFMLISCVIIIILERVQLIGTLKALGADNNLLRNVFLRLGTRVVLIALVIGNIVGIGLIYLQHHWHIIGLDPESYYLSYVPVELHITHWAILNVSTIILSLAVMMLPTTIISRLNPAKTLRFE